MLALVIFVLPAFTATRYADYSLQTFGVHRHSYKIEHDGRIFYYGKQDRAAAANMVIAAAARISQARATALRRARRSAQDAVQRRVPLLHARPTSCPRPTTSRWIPAWRTPRDSGLDQQLASADIVILSKIWDDWSEPNDSRKVGSDKSVRVLARDFCHVGTYLDLYELYRKCEK